MTWKQLFVVEQISRFFTRQFNLLLTRINFWQQSYFRFNKKKSIPIGDWRFSCSCENTGISHKTKNEDNENKQEHNTENQNDELHEPTTKMGVNPGTRGEGQEVSGFF
jgi:hypothetical protein